jgi:HEAT repeat protein
MPTIRPIINQEMHEQLVEALVRSSNEAADDLLLEGLQLGNEVEQSLILGALLTRKSVRGLSGVVERFDQLPPRLQPHVLANIKLFYHALRECGRSSRNELRIAAMKIIALSRQGKLAYVLSENLHDSQETLSKAAVEAMVALARWVSTNVHKLQRDYQPPPVLAEGESPPAVLPGEEPPADFAAIYKDVMEQRVEIETAVARALDAHRGKHTPELLRAALLLCDWPQSKTLAILHTTKHGGQSGMVRKLQSAPPSEHVDAFLLGASHGQLRLHFGSVFSHITDGPVLDAILRKTHWLKDNQLQLCMHQVTRGAWWQEGELMHDLDRRDPGDACKIGEWLAASGMHDVLQDERFARLSERSRDDLGGRLRLLRIVLRRKKGCSVQYLKTVLADPDERMMRLAAREMCRRRPPDFENTLLQLMTNAPESVRKVISRSIGQAGFEHFWTRFDRLDRPTRKQAGRAMLKLLPDATQRLARRLANGPLEQRLKAMQITKELGLAENLRETLTAMVTDPNAKIRSKAVTLLGDLPNPSIDVVLDRVLVDTDPRVRANAIEVLETRPAGHFIPVLAMRAKAGHNRERANAIKALHRMRVGNIGPQLLSMLRDDRPEHRISAMWALKKMGWWKLLQEVGNLAKEDKNLRVRRYAVSILKGVAAMVQAEKGIAG